MENLLDKMLSRNVAIPYSDELVQLLDQACHSYIDAIEDPYKDIADLTYSFLTHQALDSLYDALRKQLSVKGSDFHIPRYVSCIFAEYVVYLIITEEKDRKKQGILTTIMMNYMILIKDNYESIPYPDILTSLFKFHISTILSQTDDISIGTHTSMIEGLASSKQDISQFSDADKEELKMLVKEAELHRCFSRLQNISVTESAYQRVYNGFSVLIDNMEYLYYNFDIKDFLKILIGKEKLDESKPIIQIINEVQSVNTSVIHLESSSSVLLRLIEKTESLDKYKTLKVKELTVSQFGIYVYFELFVEQYLKKLNNA